MQDMVQDRCSLEPLLAAAWNIASELMHDGGNWVRSMKTKDTTHFSSVNFSKPRSFGYSNPRRDDIESVQQIVHGAGGGGSVELLDRTGSHRGNT
jgi:hypothetical protein